MSLRCHMRLPGLWLVVGVVVLHGGCSRQGKESATGGDGAATGTATEQAVQRIELTGPLTTADAEISGLTWFGDELILLPQYPDRFPSSDDGTTTGSVFTLHRQELLDYLADPTAGPLRPRSLAVRAPQEQERFDSFEGYEAIACHGDRVFLTVETRNDSTMLGYLVAGSIVSDAEAPGGRLLVVDTERRTPIHCQAPLRNYTDETLLVVEDRLVTMYEANGRNVNPDPHAHLFDLQLQPLGSIPVPTIEYRVTDATAVDAEGRFWVINYLFPGDQEKLQPATDGVTARDGIGPTHAGCQAVERMLELQYTGGEIVMTTTPAVQLQLLDVKQCRNWEGIVRLGETGLLLATDRYPETILAFLPWP
ncbi:MAG: hypothetical protein ABIF77_14010 [bacterium]